MKQSATSPEQSEVPTTEAPQQAAVGGAAVEQLEGNSQRQAELGGAGGGAGACCDCPGDGAATARLLDALDALFDAQEDGVDRVWDMIEYGKGPPETWPLLETAIVTAVGAVTGPAVAAVLTPALKGAPELVKKVIEKVVDQLRTTPVSEAARGAVKAILADQRGMGVEAVEGYFVGTKSAIRAHSVDVRAQVRDGAAGVAGMPGGEDAIARMADGALGRMATAESEQIRASLVKWLQVMAETDAGGEEGGIDPGRVENGGYRETRGVLHIDVNTPTTEIWRAKVVDARISGVDGKALEALKSSPLTALQLGIPVYLKLFVSEHAPDLLRPEPAFTTIEIASVGGPIAITSADEAGRAFLDRVARVRDPESGSGADDGAFWAMDFFGERTLRDLRVHA